MLITLTEVVYILILTFAAGYIFSGIFKQPVQEPEDYINQAKSNQFIENMKFSAIIAAPAIILHEFAHKFTALALGLQASFHIWSTGLLIGVILRALNFGFIFLAPGYVSILGATPLQSGITAFAGPLINLLLFVGVTIYLKTSPKISRKAHLILLYTKKINLWLFLFNMIPIPPLDGSKVLSGIISLF